MTLFSKLKKKNVALKLCRTQELPFTYIITTRYCNAVCKNIYTVYSDSIYWPKGAQVSPLISRIQEQHSPIRLFLSDVGRFVWAHYRLTLTSR